MSPFPVIRKRRLKTKTEYSKIISVVNFNVCESAAACGKPREKRILIYIDRNGKEAEHMSDSNIETARKIAKLVDEKGGTAYYVGGFVRDSLRGEENKDIDVEIHGIYPKQLEEILNSLGERIAIGESFGIYCLKGCGVDIAMPRREENRGAGHRDFDVCVDPFLGAYKAAQRRDFTVNALMQNVLTGEITDFFNGIDDIRVGVIRHVNDRTFTEDPLRVLRGAQFAARFGYTVADETVELCRTVDLSSLAKERVMGETAKALLKAEKPSVYFEVLRSMGQLSVWFPELENTIGVKQNPEHHSEGDVWTHTMMVIDAAAALRSKSSQPLGLMLSAVAHDFGKAICTREINGKIHAYDHETLGLPLIKAFMNRLTSEKALTEYVLNLCEHHMRPNMLAAAGACVKSTNRMFDRSIDPEGLILLAKADGIGKTSPREYVSYDGFFESRLAVFREYMSRPYVMGRDLIKNGVKPSERFSEYLDYAHKLRLAGVEKDSALRQTLAVARKSGDLKKEKKS